MVFGAVVGFVRFAPVEVAEWHIDLAARGDLRFSAGQGVVVLDNGAYVLADMSLAKLEIAARATLRNRQIAGSLAEGRITWETRTRVWGFADYTTAQQSELGLMIYARSRFGPRDYGVNAARLAAWIGR